MTERAGVLTSDKLYSPQTQGLLSSDRFTDGTIWRPFGAYLAVMPVMPLNAARNHPAFSRV